jgi:hypothetical protein
VRASGRASILTRQQQAGCLASSLEGEVDRRLRGVVLKRHALFDVEAHLVDILTQVPDREILTHGEFEIPAALAENHGTFHRGRPDDRATENLAEVLDYRVATSF